MNSIELSRYIDYTNLKPYTTVSDIDKLCKQAINRNYYSVCVHPCYVKLCKELLKGFNVKISTVVGFPLGANAVKTKVFEVIQALKDGVDEIDVVMNISMFKSKKYRYVFDEINTIHNVVGNKILKVIVETCYLTYREKIKICKILLKLGVDYIKTSTGFGKSGASLCDIELFKSILQGKVKIKASGGIKSKSIAIKMLSAGANRIGTSSLI